MKIIYLATGAADMYCGSCLHDNTLAAALLAAGHDVTLLPTYTPLRTDEEDVSDRHLFYGGINVYLQQHSRLFRRAPWFVDRWFDAPWLIRLAMKLGPSVEADRLGDLTVSMLQGEHGHQAKELEKLTTWLRSQPPADIVQLSNCMLLGMAREMRRLGWPVVCGLSGEDVFLEQLVEPYYSQARSVLRERARDVDAYVAMNHYYADFMADYLAVPRSKIEVVPPGINLAGHGVRAGLGQDPPRAHATIGFLARICPEKGLHHLIEAAEILQRDSALPPLRVRAAGYLGARDKPYLASLQRRAAAWPRQHGFEYVGEVSRSEKIAFLQSLDVMSLPTVYRESKGLPVLEAMANAVPVVVPRHGAFPEMIEDTGGGLLHTPDDAVSLAEALRNLMTDVSRAKELGRCGEQSVRDRYHASAMAERTLDVYRRVIAGHRQSTSPCAPLA